MVRRVRLALGLVVLLAPAGQAFEEPAAAERNLAAILLQVEEGDWNARIHAVHELEYMHDEGVPGLATATDDADWQVRMTAVHALGPRGLEGAAVLRRLLRHEPCPVVRLMTLHNLGSLGPDGEEAKAMGWISAASPKEVNACQDHPGPGRAPWARSRGPSKARSAAPVPVASEQRRPPGVNDASKPAPEAVIQDAEVEERDEPVVTRDPVPPPVVPAVPARPMRTPETLPEPTAFERHAELDFLLDASTASPARPGVELSMLGRSTAAAESLPWPVSPTPREHTVDAPGLIMADAGGRAPNDPLPELLRALRAQDSRARARAADDLGHLGAAAGSAVPPLIEALRDRSARVRSSASLALGNIGAADKRIVPLLAKALKDRSEDVRYAAALALSRIDAPEARRLFSRHVESEARRAIDASQTRRGR